MKGFELADNGLFAGYAAAVRLLSGRGAGISQHAWCAYWAFVLSF